MTNLLLEFIQPARQQYHRAIYAHMRYWCLSAQSQIPISGYCHFGAIGPDLNEQRISDEVVIMGRAWQEIEKKRQQRETDDYLIHPFVTRNAKDWRFLTQLVFCLQCGHGRIVSAVKECSGYDGARAAFNKWRELPKRAARYDKVPDCQCCALIAKKRRLKEYEELKEQERLRDISDRLERAKLSRRERIARFVLQGKAPDFMTVCAQARLLAKHITTT